MKLFQRCSSQAGVGSTAQPVFIDKVPGLNICSNILDGTDPAFCEVSCFSNVPFLAPFFFIILHRDVKCHSLLPGTWCFSALSVRAARRLNRRRRLSPTTLSTPPLKYHRTAHHVQTLEYSSSSSVLPNRQVED